MAMSCIPLLVNQPQIPTQGIDANVATARLRLRDPIPPDDTEWGWNVVMLNASADAGVREWGRSAGRSLAAAIFSTETFLSPRDFVPWLGARAQGRAADYLVAVIVAGEELSVPVAELQATIDSLRAMPEQALTTIILVTTSLRWMELRGLDGAIRVPHDMLGRAGASAYRSLCGLMAPEQLMCLDMEDVYSVFEGGGVAQLAEAVWLRGRDEFLFLSPRDEEVVISSRRTIVFPQIDRPRLAEAARIAQEVRGVVADAENVCLHLADGLWFPDPWTTDVCAVTLLCRP